MVVQHNITAMNANRMLGVTSGLQAKSTEKLSSGYKINRAADDAAGLSISEKMRKQIRGLSQASDNAEDGISCVQTAEGALTEVHSMLQRMNELAVKAGNGTMSEDDRQNVQDEIDRVSETTKFNETYLLKGDDTGAKTYSASYKTPVTNDIGYAANKTAADLAWYAEGGTTKLTLDELKSDYLEVGTDGRVALKEGKKLYTEAADTTGQYGAQKKDKIAAVADIQAVLTAKSTALTLQDGTAVKEADLANYFDADGTYKGGLYKAATDGTATEVGAEQIANYVKVTASNASDLLLSFQVGADTTSENKITVAMQSMSAKSIGVDQLKVTGSDSTNADKAVDTISDAIKKVSKQRSALGAVQNRLEHTISNLDNVVENTTSAESRIRDTDMAEEMVSYSKNNILMQAGQSMLAQANQQNQGVLSLLQ